MIKILVVGPLLLLSWLFMGGLAYMFYKVLKEW